MADYIVKETHKVKEDVNNLFGQKKKKKMSEGISNFQIEEAFKNIGDKDINGNFVRVFPSNYMNKLH